MLFLGRHIRREELASLPSVVIIVQLCRHSLRLSTSGAPAHGPVLTTMHLVVSDGLDARALDTIASLGS